MTKIAPTGGGGGGLSFDFKSYAANSSIPASDVTPGKVLVARVGAGGASAGTIQMPLIVTLADGTAIIVRDDGSPGGPLGIRADGDSTPFFGGQADPLSGTSTPGPFASYQFKVPNAAVMFALNKAVPRWEVVDMMPAGHNASAPGGAAEGGS